MDWFWKLGSMAGLFTLAFTVYDRLLASRPKVSWCRIDETIGVSIENIGDEPILIESVLVEPKECAIAFSGDRHDTIGAAARVLNIDGIATDAMTILLAANKHKVLHVVSKDGLEAIEQNLKITVRWRLCSSQWIPQMPIVLGGDQKFLTSFKSARLVS